MEDQTIILRDAEGASGVLETASQSDNTKTVLVRLPSGERLRIDRSLLESQEDGSYRLKGATFQDLETAAQSARGSQEELVIPVAEERIRLKKRKRETGRVHISKRVEEHEETVDEPLLRERVDIERVPVDRVVDGPVDIRREGATTIIPVLEEQLVVHKQLVLKEELHVTRHQAEHRDQQKISLRREVVDVQRTDLEEPRSDAGAEESRSHE